MFRVKLFSFIQENIFTPHVVGITICKSVHTYIYCALQKSDNDRIIRAITIIPIQCIAIRHYIQYKPTDLSGLGHNQGPYPTHGNNQLVTPLEAPRET